MNERINQWKNRSLKNNKNEIKNEKKNSFWKTGKKTNNEEGTKVI